MNKAQARKPSTQSVRILNVGEVRKGDRVAIILSGVGSDGKRTTGKSLAATPGEASETGSIRGEVVNAYHSGHGKITISVKHPLAAHPSGIEAYTVNASANVVVWKIS